MTSHSGYTHTPDLAAILDVAAQRLGVDFRDYRSPPLLRGIADRLQATGCADLAAYRCHLDAQPDELQPLLTSLVVPVTEFFRDAEVFTALSKTVLPHLAARSAPSRPLRSWNIGVSSGEEAWSIAMLLALTCEPTETPFDMLATDIDEQALSIARRGRYDPKSLSAVPDALRDRFFECADDGARMSLSPALRSRVHFVMHDFMGHRLAPREAIVASFNLVLIRNVLIYFDRRLQDKAFERLASTVEPGGALVLGPVEMPPPIADRLFTPWPEIDPKLRIFQRTESAA